MSYRHPISNVSVLLLRISHIHLFISPITSLCNGREINTCYYSTVIHDSMNETQRNFQTCESCPDYYPGNEPTSSTIPQPDTDNQWDGVLTLTNESSWDGGFCVSTFINNPTVKAANNFVITLSTKNCQITTLWGLKITSMSSGKVVLGPDRSVLIKPGQVGDSIDIHSRHTQLLDYVASRPQTILSMVLLSSLMRICKNVSVCFYQIRFQFIAFQISANLLCSELLFVLCSFRDLYNISHEYWTRFVE